MSDNLTEREREYLDCKEPMVSTKSAVMRIVGGVFAAIGQTIVMPTSAYSKTDQRIMRAARDIRYTKYKKAVIRKQEGKLTKRDGRLLEKLNKKPFVLENDTFDPDEFQRKLYEDIMKRREESEKN